MTIFQFTVLFLVFIVLVLIAAHIFHRYERAIFWSVALFLFIGVLVLLGTGVLKIIKEIAKLLSVDGAQIPGNENRMCKSPRV